MEQLEINQQDLKEFGSKLERIEKLLSSQSFKHTSEEAETKPPMLHKHSPNQANATLLQSATSGAQQNAGIKDQKMIDASPSSSFNTNPPDSASSEPVPSVAKQNAIHTEHNTAAQKLFRWPSIKALLQRCKKLNFTESSENYVLDMELNKGRLHLYGRGQGLGSSDGSQLGASAASPAGSSASQLSDEASDASSPAADSVWGHGFNPYVGDATRDSVSGGLCSDNTLKLDARTIDILHKSYMQNIQILHPILDDGALIKTIESFKRRYSWPPERAAKVAFALPVANTSLDAVRDQPSGFNKPPKRKHSDSQYWDEPGMQQTPPSARPMLDRSPATALVLLVLALGKICDCREAIPGPVPVIARDANLRFTDSPPPYSMRHSPSSSSYSTIPSPVGVGLARPSHLSPRSSVSEPAPRPRNLDVIPGLAYYAQATDILGNMTGSHDIAYVQCCILAGLYAGQLANTVESLTWIQYAARGCCVLARE